MTPPWRIIFAGTPDFAVPSLRALAAWQKPVAVLTQPDRPAGRGRRLAESPVKQVARTLQVPVHQPASLRGAEATALLTSLRPDAMVVAAYGLILPPGILSLPRFGCINVHASLLPRWRGAAPIQRAIMAGDTVTGVTIMQMAEGLDTGDMLHVLETPIEGTDTGGSLHDRLAELGAKALMEILPDIMAGTVARVPQDEARASYAGKLTKSEAGLDWTRPAAELARKVRALNPWPVCECRYRDQKLRIWAATALEDNAPVGTVPGEVLAADKRGIQVACGRGQLVLTTVQLPGRKPVPAADFVHAHQILGENLAGPGS